MLIQSRDEDVTQTLYKDSRKLIYDPLASQAVQHKMNNADSKTNKICDAVLAVLATRFDTNLQNVITAHLCKLPPAVEDGLRIVAELLDSDDEEMADRAAEHICFLADVKMLYEKALGLYNLELAVVIAQKSQEDPREYLPFMQNLQEMEEVQRFFSIDDYLGRHSKALGHLQTLDEFDKVLLYTRKHELYKDAMSLYRYKTTELDSLMAIYAEHLEAKSQLREAGLAYETLGNFTKATSCYLASGAAQWREALTCALLQDPPLEGESRSKLALQLIDALTESKDFFAAATIQLEYLDSLEGGLKFLCKGFYFSDAMHLATLRGRPDLLSSIIDPSLGDALASSTELIADCKAQLRAQVPRIRELREKAASDPLAFYEGDRAGGGADGDLPDDVSIAASSRLSTNNSLFTRYTNKGGSVGTVGTGVSRATSKNRRREERKRARGKKGSVYEEEYLVTSVGRLIERVERTREDIEKLVAALLRRRMLERARAIQSNLAEVVEMCSACISEVFRTSETSAPVDSAAPPLPSSHGYTPVGGDAVLQASLEAGSRPKQPPPISEFKKLSLLAA